jgi:hypothetical protein
MNQSKAQKPLWAWVVLIRGGLFLLKSFPGILLTVLIPFWKPDEFSFFSIILMLIALCLLIPTLWGMLRAFRAVKSNNLEKRFKEVDPVEEMVSTELQSEGTDKTKKTIWPWIVIGSGALLLIGSVPGALMLPIANHALVFSSYVYRLRLNTRLCPASHCNYWIRYHSWLFSITDKIY